MPEGSDITLEDAVENMTAELLEQYENAGGGTDAVGVVLTILKDSKKLTLAPFLGSHPVPAGGLQKIANAVTPFVYALSKNTPENNRTLGVVIIASSTSDKKWWSTIEDGKMYEMLTDCPERERAVRAENFLSVIARQIGFNFPDPKKTPSRTSKRRCVELVKRLAVQEDTEFAEAVSALAVKDHPGTILLAWAWKNSEVLSLAAVEHQETYEALIDLKPRGEAKGVSGMALTIRMRDDASVISVIDREERLLHDLEQICEDVYANALDQLGSIS